MQDDNRLFPATGLPLIICGTLRQLATCCGCLGLCGGGLGAEPLLFAEIHRCSPLTFCARYAAVLRRVTLTCMDEPVFDRQWANEFYLWVTREWPLAQQAAEKQRDDLRKVHEDGWKLLAGAVRDGLGGIAKAIADRR